MTKEEAVKALEAIQHGDNEAAHSQADDILLEYLSSSDSVEVAEAWRHVSNSIGFWYA